MPAGESIFQIFKQHRQSLHCAQWFPFAVRKSGWSRDFYVIVESFDGKGQVAKGIPTKQGQFSRMYGDDPGWRQEERIPAAADPVWHYLPQVDLSAYHTRQGKESVYELHHRLLWGSHRGLTIEEICQNHLDYIEWAIDAIEHSFCLSAAAMASLQASGIPLSSYTVALNQAKLRWFAHDRAMAYLPEAYAHLLPDHPAREDQAAPKS